MQSFGSYLKEQRESKNVSLKDIARSTNITERYLDLIEKDEFERVPGGAYITGYISSYASFIGIDAHETIERFKSFRRERYEAEYKQEEISKEKAKQNPIMLLLNKRKWVLISSTILIFVTLGAINLLSQDDQKALVVADLHRVDGKELQRKDDMGSTDPQSLKTNGYSMSHKEEVQLPKSSVPAVLPLDQPDDISKGESSIQETTGGSRNAAKDKTTELSKHATLKDKKSDQSVHRKPLNPEDQEVWKPEGQTLAATPGKRTGHDKPNHEKDMTVLETAVCTDVKDKNPFGKDYSVQWSTDRIYVWNLIESEVSLSSIRHIYYFKGKKVSDIALDIRSPRWRTWSYKVLSDKRFIGPWRVDITSADGKLLERVRFEVS
ncbi:MAG: DUF2914 domain-containing protein [Deltaproteobacteria bacterium]|nr:DUF2914 domain-containing protein [Deltaproteobacteria bacterium]